MKRHLGARQVLFRLWIAVSVAWLMYCVMMASVGIYQPGVDWDLVLWSAGLGVKGSLLIWLGWFVGSFAGSLFVYLVGRIGAWIGAGFRR